MREYVTVKLTKKQAFVIWSILDGALDAGSCDDGLTRAEKIALNRAVDQILPFITNSSEYSADEQLRWQIVENLERVGFSWHSDDEDKIIDAILEVVQ